MGSFKQVFRNTLKKILILSFISKCNKIMGRVQDKVILVSAAGQGIGRASCLFLAREGAKVIATDFNNESLESLRQEAVNENLDIKVKRLDVTNKEELQSVVEQIEKIDVLFNCAGYVHQGSIFECSDDIFQRSWDINVRSMFWMVKAAAAKIPDGGSIINMSSVASSVKGAPNRFAYGTTKAAVIGLTKSLAADFVARKVRVNAICPGTVETPSWHDRVNESDNPEEAKKNFIARQALGRLGTAEEIAALVTYLASNESAYTTGTVNVIDGGWSI